MKEKYKNLLLVFLFLLIEEIIFSFYTYKNITIYTILFTLLNALFLQIIFNVIKNKKIIFICYIIITILFISNYMYYKQYSSFISFDVFEKSFQSLYFYNNIFYIIRNNFFQIILLIIPLFVVLVYLSKSINTIYIFKPFILMIFIVYLTIILILNFNTNDSLYSSHNLYFKINFPAKNLYNFGLLTSIRIDMQRGIFRFRESSIEIKANNKDYSSDYYNILNIDFIETNIAEINEINKYLENQEPTSKNLYTGILKDKNLIFILAESFNSIAIDKDITPNLYRLYKEGFNFENFYNPLYPVSTADGQYMTDISLYPADSTHSLISTNKNYIPYSLANTLKQNNYSTYSYHNYLYDYYERDIYYPNMGFDTYKGIGNGLELEKERSDYELAKNTINEFINDEKFFVYYLTMSGHAPYDDTNVISNLNYDLVSEYEYSDGVKKYLATQIELDKMIGLLFSELEKANKLKDTVIVLVPDHVPYGLTIDEFNEISYYEKDNEFEKYKSDFIIYNDEINKYISNNNYCSNIDILPTLLNLFGIEYDSRLLMGKDILSNNEGMIVFGNRNIITKDYKFSNMRDIIYGDLSKDELKNLKEEIYLKFRISRLILENDYFEYLLDWYDMLKFIIKEW